MRILHSTHYPADHHGLIDKHRRFSASVRKVFMVAGWLVFMGALIFLVYQTIVFLMPPVLYE